MNLKRIFSHNGPIILALVLGILTALFAPPFLNQAADLVADVSVRIMKLLAIPLIFLSIISSAAHFTDFAHIKTIGLRIIKYTLLTTVLASLVAEFLYLLVGPLLLDNSLKPEALATSSENGFFQAFIKMVPDNLVNAFLQNNVMAIVLIAIALALAILSLSSADEKHIVFTFFRGLFNALMKIVSFVIRFMPFAIWAFVTILTREIAHNNNKSLNVIAVFTLTVIAANLLQGLVVLPLLLKWKGVSPVNLFGQVKSALILAFFTRSSAATLPLSLECAIDNAKIDKNIARLSLPLCCTINMNGCAQFILIAVYFVSAYTGHPLAWWEHFGVIVLSVIAAVGNAGVPMGCFFLASSILAAQDIPIFIMGSILPLYAIIDMVETSLNVWSDLSVTKIVDHESA
jgi:Na+/H+-dicarboxylate symporter